MDPDFWSRLVNGSPGARSITPKQASCWSASWLVSLAGTVLLIVFCAGLLLVLAWHAYASYMIQYYPLYLDKPSNVPYISVGESLLMLKRMRSATL